MNVPISDEIQRLAASNASNRKKPAPQLSQLSQGAIQEMFDEAWAQVMRNIADPNCDDTKAREIKITLTLKPFEGNPAHVEMSSSVATKLAPLATVRSSVYVEGIGSQNPSGFEIGSYE